MKDRNFQILEILKTLLKITTNHTLNYGIIILNYEIQFFFAFVIFYLLYFIQAHQELYVVYLFEATLICIFLGFGVDEDSMASILGKWHSEHLESFRKRTKFFLEDERLFEKVG